VHTLGHTCTGTCNCTVERYENGYEDLNWNPECPVAGHTDDVHSVAFSPDGNRVVSGSEDTFVKIWDVATGALVSNL